MRLYSLVLTSTLVTVLECTVSAGRTFVVKVTGVGVIVLETSSHSEPRIGKSGSVIGVKLPSMVPTGSISVRIL